MALLTAAFQFVDTIIVGKIMTVISRTHQVPIKIRPLFWKMIIIGCTTIIIVVVDRGNLEAFFESNSRGITSNWPISKGTRDQLSLKPNISQKSLNPGIRRRLAHRGTRALMSEPGFLGGYHILQLAISCFWDQLCHYTDNRSGGM